MGRRGPAGRAATTDEVFHGADDNASGVAGMLELARELSAAGPLDRSVLLVAFSAEEFGLVGSRHWLEHPPVPLDRIVAMVNLDMLGRLRDEKLMIGGVDTAPGLKQIVENAAKGSPLKVNLIWRDGLAPSDCRSFVEKRIPAVFFWTGAHTDVHKVTDRAEKINYEGEAKIVEVVAKTVKALAGATEKPLAFGGVTGPTTRAAGTEQSGGPPESLGR